MSSHCTTQPRHDVDRAQAIKAEAVRLRKMGVTDEKSHRLAANMLDVADTGHFAIDDNWRRQTVELYMGLSPSPEEKRAYAAWLRDNPSDPVEIQSSSEELTHV